MAEFIEDIEPPVASKGEEKNRRSRDEEDAIVQELAIFVKELPVSPPPGVLTRSALLRWFDGRDQNMDKAKKAIVRHLQWQLEISLAVDVDIADEVAAGKVLMAGPDIVGRPALFVFPRRHDKEDRDEGVMRKYIHFVMEQMLLQCRGRSADDDGEEEREGVEGRPEAIVIVFDLAGFTLRNMDTATLFDFIRTLQYNYPCLVKKVWIVNHPWVFSACYTTLIRPFLSREAAALVSFVSAEALEKSIPADRIPTDFFLGEEGDEEDDEDDEEEEDDEEDDEEDEEDEEDDDNDDEEEAQDHLADHAR